MSTPTADLHYLEIHQAAALLERGDLTSAELTQHMLDRIAAVDGRLRSYAHVAADEAIAAAEASDERRAGGGARSGLDGIPIAVKDIFHREGWPTEAGMQVRRGMVADSTATVVKRLERAGCVILGKVHTTEGVYTEHTPPFEPPANPWDRDRWVGVSSSGSGVATAAGLALGTLGSDTGGSIRMPSASNGVTGLKPTWGRVSRAGAIELAATLDHIGPMCRSARDAGIMLSTIAGADPDDPTSALVPVPDYGTTTRTDLRGRRIGIDPRWSEVEVSDDVLSAQRAAQELMADLGAEIVEIALPDPERAIDDWFGVCAVQTALAHRDTYPQQRELYGAALSDLIERGRSMSAMEYQELILARLAFSGRMHAAIADVDALLIPAMSFIAPPVDKMVRMDDETTAGVHRFTVPFTMSQLPTITFPAGFTTTPSGHDFPVALQLVASAFDEASLVDVCDVFQRVTGWNRRHPALDV